MAAASRMVTRSTPSSSTCSYLNGGPFLTCAALKDDASFPAVLRLRIWRLGFESLTASIIAYRDAHRVLRELGSRLGPGDSLDCVDNGGNDKPATRIGRPPAKQDRNRRRWLSSNEVNGGGLAS